MGPSLMAPLISWVVEILAVQLPPRQSMGDSGVVCSQAQRELAASETQLKQERDSLRKERESLERRAEALQQVSWQ